MLNKAFVDFYRRVKFTIPTWCPKGILHVRLKKTTHYFLNVAAQTSSWRINAICAWQSRCVVLFLTDNISSYCCTGATFVWCRLLLCCCMCDRLHYKASIKRPEASCLKYLGSAWQSCRSETMYRDRYTCSFTSC